MTPEADAGLKSRHKSPATSYFKRLEDTCESIDASVFSGDLLWDDACRNMLKEYIARWDRAINSHEAAKEESDDPRS